MYLDINCDMGESFGAYTLGRDEEILESITSANIACGFHAGDQSFMRKTVKMAVEKDVGIGAHPGLQDLIGFGRREMAVTPDEVYDLVIYQVGALAGFAKAAGGSVQHVKAHGALYNMAGKNQALAEAIAKAVYDIDPELVLFGLSGSELVKAGNKFGLPTANEVFADRTYQEDGSLTPRSQKNALIRDEKQAVDQVIRMVKEGKVQTQQGTDVSITANTVCVHGDGEHALAFVNGMKESLRQAGIHVTGVKSFL